VADAVWVFHFVAFAFLWVLAKVPIVSSWLEIVARVYKRNSFGFFLRAAYYKAKLKYLGRDVLIDQGVEIWGPANVSIDTGSHLDVGSRITAGEPRQSQRGMVEIGAHVHLGSYVHLAGRGGIKIGDYTAITYGSKIFSATNMGDNPEDPTDLLPMSHAAPLHRQRIVEAPVTIGDHVFVGLNACIMPGVSIGQGAIINSGAVVTRNVAPFTIIKGGAMSVSGKRVPKTRGGPGS
jgi:acetyltransferase-like isoleucine patch superfamily enzyme